MKESAGSLTSLETPVVHLSSLKTAQTRRVNWKLYLFILILAFWPVLAWGAAKSLILPNKLGKADAIIVLGGSAAYVERTHWAASLYHQGAAPRIILTNDNHRGGWSQQKQTNPLFYERAIDELHFNGVPAREIEVLPQPVSSTYEEAVLICHYIEEQRLKNVIIVTSPYHTRRAAWTLDHVLSNNKANVNVIFSAPPPGGINSPPTSTWWLHSTGWSGVALEYPKMIYYWLNYR